MCSEKIFRYHISGFFADFAGFADIFVDFENILCVVTLHLTCPNATNTTYLFSRTWRLTLQLPRSRWEADSCAEGI